LAVKVFQTTARYDAMISNYLYKTMEKGTFAESFNMGLSLVSTLRYGENPHQKAAVYREPLASAGAIVNAKQLHGKELSFNNYIDLEAAYAVAAEFDDAACAIIKHTNPCGTALGKTISEAFERARAADPVSAFGGIVGLNRIVDVATAKLVGETFFECIVAPGFEPEALEILKAKKNIRLMELPAFGRIGAEIDIKRVSGGLLVQERDLGKVDLRKCDVPTKRKPTDDELAELDFAWKLCKHVKSNAIVFTKGRQSVVWAQAR
jgi:phosphoribosylaminoimidazolecarboxamide formyltransferase/IMP cyclohydrolase